MNLQKLSTYSLVISLILTSSMTYAAVNGVTATSPLKNIAITGVTGSPQIIPLTTGFASVYYSTADTKTYIQLYDGSNVASGSPIVVTGAGADFTCAGGLTGGDFIVAWKTTSGSTFGVSYQRYTSAGAAKLQTGSPLAPAAVSVVASLTAVPIFTASALTDGTYAIGYTDGGVVTVKRYATTAATTADQEASVMTGLGASVTKLMILPQDNTHYYVFYLAGTTVTTNAVTYLTGSQTFDQNSPSANTITGVSDFKASVCPSAPANILLLSIDSTSGAITVKTISAALAAPSAAIATVYTNTGATLPKGQGIICAASNYAVAFLDETKASFVYYYDIATNTAGKKTSFPVLSAAASFGGIQLVATKVVGAFVDTSSAGQIEVLCTANTHCANTYTCDGSFICKAPECTLDNECVSNNKGHKCSANVCGCAANTDCPTTAALCETATSTCRECLANADCSSNVHGHKCSANVCGCSANADCPTTAAICDTTNSLCRECTVDNDCGSNANGKKCSANVCGCATNTDCPTAQPTCTSGKCVAAAAAGGCSLDSDCGSNALGHKCISSACGCASNTDCPASSTCTITSGSSGKCAAASGSIRIGAFLIGFIALIGFIVL